MTRQRNDDHSTEFGLWLRKQAAIDSGIGYVTTNLDYLWSNYTTGEWMLLEEKRHGAFLTDCQVRLFRLLDSVCQGAPGYCGFHRIRFENTNPDDGKIWLDGKLVTPAELIAFLQFSVTVHVCQNLL